MMWVYKSESGYQKYHIVPEATLGGEPRSLCGRPARNVFQVSYIPESAICRRCHATAKASKLVG